MTEQKKEDKTIILFSNDLDKVLAAFNIAVGAAAMGFKVNIYFTFWGLNVLRKKNAGVQDKPFIDRIFAMMMPKGPEKLVLSKMNTGGLGSWVMKKVMKRKQVAMLPELIKNAQDLGVNFIACQMSMDMLGIKREELMGGLSYAGVAGYLEAAEKANVNLFI